MKQIPKTIHYCWFGQTTPPKGLQKNIDLWKQMLPGWEIRRWNEQNFDIENSIPYVKEAYQQKKYAFVSDYVRLCVLRDYGGVYLDADMQIQKSFQPLLEAARQELVMGFETKTRLMAAFIASVPQNSVLCELIESYEHRHFVLENGRLDLTTINEAFTDWMKSHGLELNNSEQSICADKVRIYPFDYFAGYDVENAHPKITQNTYTFHSYSQSSWKKTDLATWVKYNVVVAGAQKILGYDSYDKLKEKLGL